ncbi:DNA mismatch repair protein MutL [Geotalea daltonii FRC-32]|uniref:DNA mismatch repair protein MutL n=1 Tax=Geotalea daltonii (strain DSM 22248 / JCM 15807 / FRC-32) TaxID=316067 RepID=MUTL_GEODF|nr:DNA mismatch repair endonuclease MutL [Geotalea daltonii]B9M3N0.1 RecName: Full=DNA mismatch repair protein MutL [Geotalea daltonii FRC-32]ACM21451.1 DNA mismatch repair protein MutL [Geotalea daltonii FRC-32]
MATRIKILPEQLTNKIAAGEVVERPASVVKELVENALDAGCSEVMVEIEAGGKRLIRVSDTGCGMTREDALLALERHATSKIANDEDLFSLATLGFRGEALPSVASVSRFTLATREKGSLEGTEIYAEGGRIKEVKACGMAEGTVISVRNLFFNTPARLKFMKSSETEAGHVGDLLTRLAISRPDIRFIYTNDGKTVFRALNADLRERVATLLGRTLSQDLYPLDFCDGQLNVTGLVGKPECSRSAASHVYTYINGRFIRDKVVQHAVLQAYRNFMERGRYPVVVLFISVPAAEVDVNVHPTKHEVRFREQGRVHDAIQEAVESVLRSSPWVKTQPVVQKTQASTSIAAARIAQVRESLTQYRPQKTTQQSFKMSTPAVPASFRETSLPDPVPVADAAPAPEVERGYFSGLSVIGQFNAAYILCQDGNSLVIIDQHAAHERVAFERLKTQHAAMGVESQRLLFPETVEFSFKEGAVIREHQTELDRVGFSLEEFGGSTWLLNAVPHLLSGNDYVKTLRDILEELQSLGRSRSFQDILEDILARIACHSVVRGSHCLSQQEIKALFQQMDTTEFSSNCPHGRPVLHTLTLAEIERMFKR